MQTDEGINVSEEFNDKYIYALAIRALKYVITYWQI